MLRPAIFWATLGSIAGTAFGLSQQTGLVATHGYGYLIVRNLLASFAAAYILILVWAVVIKSGSEMAARPGRFIAALAIGAAFATGAVWGIDLVMPLHSIWPRPQRLMDSWMTIALYGAVFGWAAVLNIRRIEDQGRLDTLLARRSVLALQVAHSNLLTARAKIDPDMVVRLLKDVRVRYQSGPDEAATLLDLMISYLRLAMNREREKKFSLTSELALARAYVALREAETDRHIGIHVNVQGGGASDEARALPIFAIAKTLIDQALIEQTKKIGLLIDVLIGELNIGLDTGAAQLDEAALERIRASLQALPNGGSKLNILHQSMDMGSHRYVVKING
ncbi:MAG: histidine kinase [Burkholderiales bacterium]|nr:histidine kinase [Burkholderiales bacterium]